MVIPFVKMHGLGNDYLFIDAREAGDFDPFVAAPVACDRRTGVGADGIVMHGPAVDSRNHASMVVVNADGSNGGVCGNGLRCLAMLLDRDQGLDGAECRVETPGGVVRLRVIHASDGEGMIVEGEMGPPRLELSRIPAVVPGLDPGQHLVDQPLAGLDGVEGSAWESLPDARISLVSMGNPHLVIELPGGGDRDQLDELVRRIGSDLEMHSWFPERTNVHLMAIDEPGRILLSTWERGSGATKACGTGACAAAVAARMSGSTPEWQAVELPGGRLDIGWTGELDAPIRQRGPAVEVLRDGIDASTGLEPRADSGEDGGR